MRAASRASANRLLSRRVVSRLGVNVKWRKPFGREQLDLDFAPGAIVTHIAWFISEDILVTQLHSNLSGNIGQVAQAGDGEDAATGHLREFRKQAGSVALLGGSPHIVDIKNSHGVELAVCFLQEVPDVRFVLTPMIISPIGDDEQGTLAVLI